MLTEEERENIRAEEIFRAEIRASLSGEKSTRVRAWEVLNSAFALWLLSTVAIGLITWSYSTMQEKQARNAASQKTITNIDIEVAQRLTQFRLRIVFVTDPYELANAIDILHGVNPAFQEYRGRSLDVLLLELEDLLPDREQEEVRKATSFARSMLMNQVILRSIPTTQDLLRQGVFIPDEMRSITEESKKTFRSGLDSLMTIRGWMDSESWREVESDSTTSNTGTPQTESE